MTGTRTTATQGYVASALQLATLGNQTRAARFAIFAANVKLTCKQTQDQTNNYILQEICLVSYTVHDPHTYNSYARLRS